jgi:hypothetical protein
MLARAKHSSLFCQELKKNCSLSTKLISEVSKMNQVHRFDIFKPQQNCISAKRFWTKEPRLMRWNKIICRMLAIVEIAKLHSTQGHLVVIIIICMLHILSTLRIVKYMWQDSYFKFYSFINSLNNRRLNIVFLSIDN